jgi:Protein of unknown function (DUF5131)
VISSSQHGIGTLSDRVDGSNLEPHQRLHEGISRLRSLLCGSETRRFPKTFPNGFALTLRPTSLDIPLRWKQPRTIFVNSMSDLFHADVTDDYLQLVFEVMCRTPHHTYQILTKRPSGLLE